LENTKSRSPVFGVHPTGRNSAWQSATSGLSPKLAEGLFLLCGLKSRQQQGMAYADLVFGKGFNNSSQDSTSEIKAVAVENWLGTIPRADGTKAKIRNIMSAVFNHAVRHEWLDKNPITLVRQSAKRESIPEILTVEELRALLAELELRDRTLVLLDAGTGLRVGELLGLKWQDVDFEARSFTRSSDAAKPRRPRSQCHSTPTWRTICSRGSVKRRIAERRIGSLPASR
jgi:hypothetical protein